MTLHENKSLRDLLRHYVAIATAKTDAIRLELEAARDSAADKDRELRDEGMRVIAEMDRLGETVGQTVSETVVVKSKSAKKTGKNQKRFHDSAVGMIEE